MEFSNGNESLKDFEVKEAWACPDDPLFGTNESNKRKKPSNLQDTQGSTIPMPENMRLTDCSNISDAKFINIDLLKNCQIFFEDLAKKISQHISKVETENKIELQIDSLLEQIGAKDQYLLSQVDDFLKNIKVINVKKQNPYLLSKPSSKGDSKQSEFKSVQMPKNLGESFNQILKSQENQSMLVQREKDMKKIESLVDEKVFEEIEKIYCNTIYGIFEALKKRLDESCKSSKIDGENNEDEGEDQLSKFLVDF
jgi:hypothetical protein